MELTWGKSVVSHSPAADSNHNALECKSRKGHLARWLNLQLCRCILGGYWSCQSTSLPWKYAYSMLTQLLKAAGMVPVNKLPSTWKFSILRHLLKPQELCRRGCYCWHRYSPASDSRLEFPEAGLRIGCLTQTGVALRYFAQTIHEVESVTYIC